VNVKLSLLVAHFWSVSLAPTYGGIGVDPVPWSPEVHIRGERHPQGQGTSGGSSSGPIGRTPSDPVYRDITPCRIDPVIGRYGCRDVEPAEPEADEPEVTPGDVLRAVREIGLPSLQLKIQPGAETLVNVDAILYTEPQPFERSVELLGFDVDLVAEPVGYRWIHGDGTTATTTGPGRPYPAMDVVHRYTAPSDDVQARVDVTYRVRFRVDGAAWQTIGQTLLASGPTTTLDVDEAAPVLTRP
jgi:hypothetical protein